jgi:hypothetical protein
LKYQANDYFLTSNEMLIKIRGVHRVSRPLTYMSTVYLTKGRIAFNMYTIEVSIDTYTKITEMAAKKWMRLNGHDI